MADYRETIAQIAALAWTERTVTGMESKYDPDEFFNRKKQTNADRIRAMTDEELSYWLGTFANCPEGYDELGVCVRQDEACSKCWLDWLQQEVDTDDN